MVGETLDMDKIVDGDQVAYFISKTWREFATYRHQKTQEWRELRNFLYATDTRTTSAGKLPWSNSTTTPKLTQIRDNLHANYFAALFPNSNWMIWEGESQSDVSKNKRSVVESYMKTKLRLQNFEVIVEKLIDDWLLYGNCFARVDFERRYNELETGQTVVDYQGPVLERISPYDIVFNPTASSFEKSPKIIRTLTTLGELKKRVLKNPEDQYLKQAFDNIVRVRTTVSGQEGEVSKSDAYLADGFGSIQQYYDSGYVELLTFYGDWYDIETDELHEKRKIVVADRHQALSDEPIRTWDGHDNIFHCPWRPRPDNLYGMGPLDNLIGLQYRLDHLENMKADVWDQIAYPQRKIRGDVQAFENEPGANIYLNEEADVEYLAPDPTALQADIQVRDIMQKMEELAGAPQQAMGVRTPGEKTAFEMSVLQNGASRIFQHKAQHFEKTFIERILNAMLQEARRKTDGKDIVRTLDDDTGAAFFFEITKDDLAGSGNIRAKGARHFAERAQRVQNLIQLLQAKADPTISAHLSGKEMAKIISEELGEKSLYAENVAVFEQAETQRVLEEQNISLEEERQVAAQEGI